MALVTYDNLVTEIKNYAVRTDADFSASIPTFIQLAELRLINGHDEDGSAPVRVQEMELETTLTLVAGKATLPTNYLSARNISVNGGRYALDYMDPNNLNLRLSYSTGGDPLYYTIKGRELWTSTAMDGDLQVLYYFKPDALSATNTTNELFAAYPELYLTAAMIEAQDWISDDAAQAKAINKHNGFVRALNSAAKRTRYSGGQRVMRPRVVA